MGPMIVRKRLKPVLGRLPGVDGVVLGYGFSGQGFKLLPALGRVLAQEVLVPPWRSTRQCDNAPRPILAISSPKTWIPC